MDKETILKVANRVCVAALVITTMIVGEKVWNLNKSIKESRAYHSRRMEYARLMKENKDTKCE